MPSLHVWGNGRLAPTPPIPEGEKKSLFSAIFLLDTLSIQRILAVILESLFENMDFYWLAAEFRKNCLVAHSFSG